METTNPQLNNFLLNCVVVLAAGGEGSRFQSVPGASLVQKAAFVLPNGECMIERTIKAYRDAGIKDFVILAYHKAGSIEKAIGSGEDLGVRVRYSYDPGKPVGRGGAMKHALAGGTIPKGKHLIVHNPDDQLVPDPVSIIRKAIEAHVEGSTKGAVATAVMVRGTYYDYSGFEIMDGVVVGATLYPFISVPTHIGMTIFSPEVAGYFERLFSLSQKSDFESVLFPVLTEERKLSAHFIPTESWIAVNDEKGLKKLAEALG